jgi:solute carrier family 25 (mitochondrial phosphate transporter), member 23/24/25/41
MSAQSSPHTSDSLSSSTSTQTPPPTTMADPEPDPVRFPAVRSWVSQPVIASFMAGGVAGAVSRTVVSPLERLKILLQVQSGGHSEYKMSIWKALQKMWREEGMKGMMAGNGTNCVRIVPYSAVQFGSYNIYKPLVSHAPFTGCTALSSCPPIETVERTILIAW